MADGNISTLFGNSQTFVGVLVTLIVLCLFNDNSNFLLNLISKFNEDMHKYMNECSASLKETIKSKFAPKDKGIERIDFWLNHGDDALKGQLLRLQSDAQITENQFYIESNRQISEYNEKIKVAKNRSELMFIEFHLFVLSVVLMLLDACIHYCPFFGIFVYLLTLMSFSFTIVLWYNYRSNRADNLPVTFPEQLARSNWSIIGSMISSLIIISLFVSCVAIGVFVFFTPGHKFISISLFSLAFVVIAVLHSSYALKNMCNYKYNTRFIATHTLFHLLISFAVTVIIYLTTQISTLACEKFPELSPLFINLQQSIYNLFANNYIGLLYALYLLFSCFIMPLLVGYFIDRKNARYALSNMQKCYNTCINEAKKNAEKYDILINSFVDSQSQKTVINKVEANFDVKIALSKKSHSRKRRRK